MKCLVTFIFEARRRELKQSNNRDLSSDVILRYPREKTIEKIQALIYSKGGRTFKLQKLGGLSVCCCCFILFLFLFAFISLIFFHLFFRDVLVLLGATVIGDQKF